MEITRQEYEAIINNGNDINMSKISGCSSTSMDQCEQCRKYYDCHTIAIANDILAAYENDELKIR